MSHVILDLVQNSVSAKADKVEIKLTASKRQDLLSVLISDNGKGMDEEQVRKATNPFYSTRETRDIGLGLPFAKMMAEQANGDFKILSKPSKGTNVYFSFRLSHWDCPPIGDLSATFVSLFIFHKEILVIFKVKSDDGSFTLSNQEIYKELSASQITEQWVIEWVREYFEKNLVNTLKEG
ncbi:ATP-binding protein [Proteinivorax tanatarense]|uniref:histidine kinase n=1 Tax=Proteinivorax tanatarense TaxID=1260629 RepID=A0AAU7VI23_9FIRM